MLLLVEFSLLFTPSRETSERWGGAHMGFLKHKDIIINWTDLNWTVAGKISVGNPSIPGTEKIGWIARLYHCWLFYRTVTWIYHGEITPRQEQCKKFFLNSTHTKKVYWWSVSSNYIHPFNILWEKTHTNVVPSTSTNAPPYKYISHNPISQPQITDCQCKQQQRRQVN